MDEAAWCHTSNYYTIISIINIDYHYLDKHISYRDNRTIAIIAQPYI